MADRQFLVEYIKNPTNATEVMNLCRPHLNRESAAVMAYKVLRKPPVRKHIEEVLSKSGASAETVAAEWNRIIFEGETDHVRLRAIAMWLELVGAKRSQAEAPPSQEYHQHLHVGSGSKLDSEPPEVLRFVAMTGKMPTEEQREALLTEAEVLDLAPQE